MQPVIEGELDLESVRKKSLTGVLSLISRTFVVQIIAFASMLLLTIFLDPKTFGIFYLVSAFVNFFQYFSDVGLAAALIQKREKLEERDLKTTFFLQQLLVIAILILIFSLSSLIKGWYNLDKSAVYLLFALAFSFFLSSLKTIPSVLLERNLKFNLLIIPQIVETLVFNILVVFLAWKGFGINSFTWAVLARGITGLAVIYVIAPWRMGIAFSKQSLKELLKFGLPYQANTIIAVVKDDLMTIILGKIIGASGLGYLGWAKKWAETPLRFLMDNVSKVAFPAFARIQGDKEKLIKAVEKSLFFLCFFTFPILIGFSVFASDLVKIIPRYLKWQPALFALYLYCFNSAWATISTPMTNLLNAVGKIKTTFKLMVIWLTLTWAIMPILAVKFGYNGVAVASAIIAFSSVFAIIAGRKQVPFGLIGPVFKPLVASLAMGLTILFLKINFENLTLSVVFRIIMGGVIYFVVSYLLIGQSLLLDIKKIYYEFKQKN